MGNPVYFEGDVVCMFGINKHVVIPTHPAGSDPHIYVNGERSAYKFGADGCIYKTVSGVYVSNLPVEVFARTHLGEQ